MTLLIDNWTDGLRAIRQHAFETRGHDDPLPTIGHRPLTTGADALAIAAVFDDAVWDHGSPGLVRRWIAALDDLERDALDAPDEVYANNRSFWATLEAAAVILDDVGAEAPDQGLWGALMDELAAEVRNAGPSTDGPIAQFQNIHTYDDLYRAEYAYLCETRGADTLAPPTGMTGATMPIPRTLNSDVLQLSTYWTDALTNTKHEMGYDTTLARWKATLADITETTQKGAPTDVYAKNNEFWHDLQHVSTQVAVSDEAPSGWQMFVSSVEASAQQLPQTLDKLASAGESAAEHVGRAASAVAKGLLEGIGAPVLVGAGILGMMLLRGRHRRRDNHEVA
jgi:hypothetical protein